MSRERRGIARLRELAADIDGAEAVDRAHVLPDGAADELRAIAAEYEYLVDVAEKLLRSDAIARTFRKQ